MGETGKEEKHEETSGKGKQVVSQRVVSPYDLNSNDNPGNIITQVQLRGENYDEWTRAIRTSLRARRKWGFVESSIEQPKEGTTEIEDWWTVQSMLVSWILNTIEPSLRSTIAYMENAKDLWEDIKDRFSITNGPRIHQLKSELADCKQGGLTVVAYYGKLKTLWDDLANYEQIPICKCEGCTCGIASKLEKRREEEKVHQFLMGLDDVAYGNVRSNMLACDPLPSLNRIYSAVVQEERVRSITRSREERGEVMGLAAQIRGRGREDATDEDQNCSHCNRAGHDVGNCFQLVGYPDWWGDRPKGEKKSGRKGKLQTRVGAGRGRAAGVRANAARVEMNGGASTSITDADRAGLTGLTADQWERLVDILNKSNIDEKMTGPHFEDVDWSG